MMRHHRGAPEPEEESSSDEEDAFSALSSSKSKRAKTSTVWPSGTSSIGNQPQSKHTQQPVQQPRQEQQQQQRLPASLTSSMKRHHTALSDARKAKMENLLSELQATERTVKPHRSARDVAPKGSFVRPGEEHLTTNLFLGNLATSITEEQLTELFSQFGEALCACLFVKSRVVLTCSCACGCILSNS